MHRSLQPCVLQPMMGLALLMSDSLTGGTGGAWLRPDFDPLAAGVNLLGLFPAFLPFFSLSAFGGKYQHFSPFGERCLRDDHRLHFHVPISTADIQVNHYRFLLQLPVSVYTDFIAPQCPCSIVLMDCAVFLCSVCWH